METSIQSLDSGRYWAMFVSVFVMNTAFAIDCWLEAKKKLGVEGGAPSPAGA